MALSGLMSKVNFANKVPLLMRATSSDPNPPAGHVYEEISRITFDSLDQCDVLVEFLTDRLKKNSPNIKLKVLLIMKFLVQKGHREFQNSLSKQADGIRQARSFSGPPDPLHGDAPYVKVRDAAAQLLEILFDTDRERNSEIHAHGYRNPATMEGFGSSMLNSGDCFANNSKSMEGFGSNLSQGNQGSGVVSDVFQRVKDNISYAFNANADAVAKYCNNDADRSTDAYQSYHNLENKIVRTPSTTFNIAGSTSQTSSEGYKSLNEQKNYSEVKWDENSKSESQHMSGDETYRILGENAPEATNDWSQEVRLVNDITIPGGIKLNPSRSDLDYFIKRCGSLDFAKIVELVGQKLRCPDYKVQMKSLFVVESILNSSIADANQIISNDLLGEIEKLATSNQTAVKNKATKLLHILKPRNSSVDQEEVKCSSEKNIYASNDELLSLGNDVKSENSNKIADSDKINVMSGNDQFASIFGGLDLKNEPTPPNTEALLPVDLSLPQSKASSTNLDFNTEKSDLLFGMSVSEPQSNLVSAEMQPIRNTSQTTLENLFDLDPFNLNKNEYKMNIYDQTNSESKDANSMKQKGLTDASVSGFDFLDPFSNSTLAANSQQKHLTNESSNNQPYNQGFTTTPSNKPQFTQHMTQSDHQMNSPYYGMRKGQTGCQNNNLNLLYKSPIQSQTHVNSANYFSQAKQTESSSVMKERNESRKNASTSASSKSQPSNGFQFISSRKPGAFDFVKDAMEASKRK